MTSAAVKPDAGRRLGRDVAVTSAANVAVAVGGLLLYRLLSLEKGAEGMASYALIKQGAVFLIPVTMLGLQTAIPRYVALARDREGGGEHHLLASLVVAGAMTAILSGALLVSPGATASVLFGDPDRTYLVVPLVLTLVATVVFEVIVGYYRGRSEFRLASAALVLTVAAFPVVLLLVVPDRPIEELVNLMAIAVLAAAALMAVRPLARVLRALRPGDAVAAARTMIDFGYRRVLGDYAFVVLFTAPTVVAAHVAPLRDVAHLTAGMYVMAVISIAFAPIGRVFLPLLSRLSAEDFPAARRWVGKLSACSLHIAIFATPQLLLFADVAVRAWLGPDFEDAGTVIRITMLPVVMFIFFLVLRTALDAAAVKAYNTRISVIAVAVSAAAAAVTLQFDIWDPIVAIAVSFALGIFCLGTLTLTKVHSVFGLESSDYALRAALLLSVASAGLGALVRFALVGDGNSLVGVVAIGVFELLLATLYLRGLSRAGVTWPAEFRARFAARAS